MEFINAYQSALPGPSMALFLVIAGIALLSLLVIALRPQD